MKDPSQLFASVTKQKLTATNINASTELPSHKHRMLNAHSIFQKRLQGLHVQFPWQHSRVWLPCLGLSVVLSGWKSGKVSKVRSYSICSCLAEWSTDGCRWKVLCLLRVSTFCEPDRLSYLYFNPQVYSRCHNKTKPLSSLHQCLVSSAEEILKPELSAN